MRLPIGALALAGLAVAASAARAQPADAPPLTLARAVALALEGATDLHAARARLVEARAQRVGAGLRDNPTVEASAGPRFATDATSVDLTLGATLPLDLQGRRAHRLAVADARLSAAEADLALVRSEVALAVVAAWIRLGAAQGALEVDRAGVALAEELVAAVQGREAAGTASGLDRAVAEAELARARARLSATEFAVAQARAELARLVAAPEALSAPIDADLAAFESFQMGGPTRGADVADAVPADLLALEARARVARAEAALAETAATPEVALGLFYTHEEGAHVATAGLSVTLPVFDRGQGDLALARAQEAAALAERDAAERRLAAARLGALQAHRAAQAATEAVRDQVVPSADRAVAMAREAYLAGKTDLGTLVSLRREALEARAALQERLLEQALAGVAVWSASGAPLPFTDPPRTAP